MATEPTPEPPPPEPKPAAAERKAAPQPAAKAEAPAASAAAPDRETDATRRPERSRPFAPSRAPDDPGPVSDDEADPLGIRA